MISIAVYQLTKCPTRRRDLDLEIDEGAFMPSCSMLASINRSMDAYGHAQVGIQGFELNTVWATKSCSAPHHEDRMQTASAGSSAALASGAPGCRAEAMAMYGHRLYMRDLVGSADV